MPKQTASASQGQIWTAKVRAGLLRDLKFARAVDETIMIVDPAKRQIVDIITKADGTR